jgi:hypothetical protein
MRSLQGFALVDRHAKSFEPMVALLEAQDLAVEILINAFILPPVGRMPAGRRPFSRPAKYPKLIRSPDRR